MKKKLKIPQPFLLAALLMICSVGLPILMLRLGDMSRYGSVEQEPLPYNLNVEQEPYSVSEKMEILESQRYDQGRDSLTTAEQDLIGSELWNSGTVEDVVGKKLAAICTDLGISVPKAEITRGAMLTITDRSKPALSLRLWAIVLEGQSEYVDLVLDVDTGYVYTFLISGMAGEEVSKTDNQRLYKALMGQIDAAGQWYLEEAEALMFDDSGLAIFHLMNESDSIGWHTLAGATEEDAPEEAEKIGVVLSSEIVQAIHRTQADEKPVPTVVPLPSSPSDFKKPASPSDA